MADPIIVSAPARLHFGLFSIGRSLEIQFGGCGLMITDPRTIVTASAADELIVSGQESDLVWQTLHGWFSLNGPLLASGLQITDVQNLPVTIDVRQTARRHSGLGSGTQLALSVVTAVVHCLGLPALSASELARAAGRAKRSAIGSHGFFQGGFLVDRGKGTNDVVAPLELRLDFPTDWPIIIVLLPHQPGLSGRQEKNAFATLPDSCQRDRDSMIQIVKQKVIQGIVHRDYDQFAIGLYDFGRRSGMMFESLQGGPYNGPAIESTVEFIRAAGVPAVGQSSWGPGVFAIAPDISRADHLVRQLTQHLPPTAEISVCRADNQGASLSKHIPTR